jgi:gamma-glutamyltranspeptidase/glutathione hydrolase
MRAGGNAVDAAVCAALVAGVASPSSSGIGGGGFVLAWLSDRAQPYLLDFRETAPEKLDGAPFEARPLPEGRRGVLSGVPGEVKGLFELHQRFGKRPWADVVKPAARWATGGFPINPHLASALSFVAADLSKDPGLSSVFFSGGKPAAVGQLVKNPKLGKTLERIAAEGPKAIYEGPIADDIVETVRAAGGSLSRTDLARYKPVERQPLRIKWEEHDVYSMPPPSAGGLMLAETLGMFSSAELRKLGLNSASHQHLLAEAMRGAIADRMRYVGDPDHVPVDVTKLFSPSRLAARKRRIAPDRTHAIPRFGLEEHGTHHLVTADAAGNVVSLTTTVNNAFGVKLTAKESGIVLNDQLDDFTAQRSIEGFGMKASPNAARPGARPVSSMTPTIVVRAGQPLLAIGGSGGMTIATNVTELTLSRLVFGTAPAELVKAPRFYVPTQGAYIQLEKGAPEALVRDLEARGEIVGTAPFTTSAVQLIALEKGRKLPAADPRKHGSARAE